MWSPANLFRTQFFAQNVCLCVTPINSCFTTYKAGLHDYKEKKRFWILFSHTQLGQAEKKENKGERDTDTLKEMGETEKQTERENGKGRHSKKRSLERVGRLSPQPTVNKPPWEIQDSCTHSYTHIHTTKRTKHDKIKNTTLSSRIVEENNKKSGV